MSTVGPMRSLADAGPSRAFFLTIVLGRVSAIDRILLGTGRIQAMPSPSEMPRCRYHTPDDDAPRSMDLETHCARWVLTAATRRSN
jgi:hypothetical protein